MDMLEILRLNCGFDEPEPWVDIGHRYGFTRVPAVRLKSCPDCGGDRFAEVGRYVYYSQLMRLQHCRRCDLVFSDVRLDRATLDAHFETAYKSDAYFEVQRALVFQRLRELLVERFRPRRSVLDVGGGKGHLARMLTDAGFAVTLNDRSREACAYARDVFGVPTQLGDVVDVARRGRRFDAVLLIDVLYYLDELPRAWEALGQLVADDGVMILRVPNRLWWIRPWEKVIRLCGRHRLRRRVSGFNPEHMYAFTARYLRRRLQALRFSGIQFLPSPPLSGAHPVRRSLAHLLDAACAGIYRVTGGTVVASPARFVIAER